MINADILFQSYQLTSQISLKNRIIMAPMTRNRASDDASPTLEMMQYHADMLMSLN